MASDQKTAILSCFNKDGLLDLAAGLVKANVRLLASGGTSRILREANFPVEDVSTITGAPEILGGRVKTLAYQVHAGILAQDTESDLKDLAEQKVSKVDIVVCNLYPFEETIKKPGVTLEEAIEQVDIGGVVRTSSHQSPTET